MWSVKSSDIIDRLVISGHEILQKYHHWKPELMTFDKLICAVESGKYEGASFAVGEEYIMESTFHAKLFIRVWFNVVTELEEYLYLHTLLFLIEFHDLARLGGVKDCWTDNGHMLSSGREGAAPLIVKMEDRLSGDSVVGTSDTTVFRNRLYVMAAQLWYGSVFIKEEKRNWWLRMETSTPSCSWTFWKISAFHTKEELMETTFGCKTPTFAHTWLLQCKNFLKHLDRCWYHDPLAP